MSIEIVRKVHDDRDGVYLEVGPDLDTGTALELRAVGKASIEYFGQIRLMLTHEMAAKLGKALIDASKEKE
jgi:hypothetical protein